MMVSMQQSLTNFQLSMAEDKVERKARMDKELELREHMLQIEEMKLKDMELRREQAQRDAEAAATYQEAQTKAQELRQKDLLEEEKKRREQREKEAQAKEEARKQREDARKKDERLKAIPNMVPMTRQTDLLEYLALFETTQKKKERLEESWAIHLLPLLNDKFRTVAMNMQPEDREKYQSLKQKLTEAEDRNLKNAVQSFWTLPKDKGMSIRDYASRLLRLLKRFAEDTDPQEVLQKVLRERVIQVLPKEAKAFVRNREPQTVSAACSLAEQYFANDEKDLTSWDSRSSDYSQPYRKQHRERGRQQHYQQDNNKWQHNQKKQPEQTETKTPSKQGDPSEQSHQKQGGGQQQKWRGSGYKDRRGDRNSDKPQGSKEKSDKVVCQLCKGNGHVATDCPTRVNVVSNLLEPPHINLPLVNGTVNTKHVADILLDTE